MDTKPTLTIEQANAEITAGIQNLVIRALQNDLAAARVRISELETSIVAATAAAADVRNGVRSEA